MEVEVRESVQLECTCFISENSDFRKSHLAPYLPSHPFKDSLLHGTTKSIEPQAAAPFGSASILLISYAYIKMMGT
jgi:glycine cleavage system protein P-like pyridoxal-binding family